MTERRITSSFTYAPPQDPFLDILYHDDDIMVVNKPSGLLSVPGRLVEHRDSVLTRIKTMHPEAMAVHRLDMDTSGVMVYGLTPQAISALGRMFCYKEVFKKYVALVYGRIGSEGEVTLPLRCDLDNRPLQIVDFEQGKSARTLYKRLDDSLIAEDFYHDDISLVELTPVTGRSHQLRVHLNELGHPILGDRFYAHEKALSLSSRLCLHAVELEFRHPLSHDMLHIVKAPEFTTEKIASIL